MTASTQDPLTAPARSVPGAPAAALSTLARELYHKGWMEATSGNLSVRITEDTVLITASGRDKGRLNPADTVLVRAASGDVLAGSARPSAETSIHLALYRAVPDCGAVLHAHSPYASALASRAARAGASRVRFTDFELIKGMGPPFQDRLAIPVFPNWADVPRIAQQVGEHFAGPVIPVAPALLIAHHGVTAWGTDLDQARTHLECLEALCRLTLLVDPAVPGSYSDQHHR